MPNGMTASARVRLIDDQLANVKLDQAVALLKRANRYVGTHSSIGGQNLGTEITEFVAAHERGEPI